MNRNSVFGAFLGAACGDALGVPYEFRPRKEVDKAFDGQMRGYMTHNQPPGTWSDDSSLFFCCAESLCEGYSIHDMADRFFHWLTEGYCTPHGEVFDVGNTTRDAILQYPHVTNPTEAGAKGEFENGNGSLMRILPLAFYLFSHPEMKKKVITEVSSLTHAHPRSILGCALYLEFALLLLEGNTREEAFSTVIKNVMNVFTDDIYKKEIAYFKRLPHLLTVSYSDLRGSGYVVDTLESSLWCLLQTDSYEEAVSAAVRLGEDTDTTGAVTGGLAGLFYGQKGIPECWLNTLVARDYIISLCESFYKKVCID